MIEVKITKVTLIQGSGPDEVYLETNLPPSIWPFTASAVMKLPVSQGKGEQYCMNNFPDVPIEIIKTTID